MCEKKLPKDGERSLERISRKNLTPTSHSEDFIRHKYQIEFQKKKGGMVNKINVRLKSALDLPKQSLKANIERIQMIPNSCNPEKSQHNLKE